MGSLITGVGYIGARLARLLLDAGERVVGLDNLFSTDRGAIERLCGHPGFTFVEGDVRDEAGVRRAFDRGIRIDTVYHLAAQASSNAAAAPARYTEETNLIGSRIVLDIACEAAVRTVVFGSSVQVYGRAVEGEVSETRPYGPILDISHLSKVHVEKLLEMYAATRDLRCVSARIGLVYGLSPMMKTDPRFMTAPNKFCLLAARGEGARVDPGAYFRTSMIHVEDVARGLMEIARAWGSGISGREEAGGEPAKHGGSGYMAINLLGETISVVEVAGLVADLAQKRGLRLTVERPADPPRVPEVEFRSGWEGFVPRRRLEEGLAEVLDFFRSTETARR